MLLLEHHLTALHTARVWTCVDWEGASLSSVTSVDEIDYWYLREARGNNILLRKLLTAIYLF